MANIPSQISSDLYCRNLTSISISLKDANQYLVTCFYIYNALNFFADTYKMAFYVHARLSCEF